MLLQYKIVTSTLFSVHMLQVSKLIKVFINWLILGANKRSKMLFPIFQMSLRARFVFSLIFFSFFMTNYPRKFQRTSKLISRLALSIRTLLTLSRTPFGTHLKWNKLMTDVKRLRNVWVLVRAIWRTFDILFIYKSFNALFNHSDRRCESNFRLTQHLKQQNYI